MTLIIFIGHTLKEAALIEPIREPCLMGVKLTFENNLHVEVVNLGDEMFIYEYLPEEIVQEEIEYTAVRRKRL